MPKLSWRLVLLVLMLPWGLAACGNGDETGGPDTEESFETSQPEAQTTTEDQSSDTPVTAEQVSEPITTGEASLDEETQAGVTAMDEGEGEGEGAPLEDVEADAETLGESPNETLEEGAALPGETTRDDVDAMIEETERRFEEASRRIEEQFEAAEQAPMEFEPMDSPADLAPGEDPIDEFAEPSALDDPALPAGGTDVDAFLEEQERRFKEAQRQLDEQFEDVEQDSMEFEPIEAEADSMP